ncbi:MAG: hypothetical protein OES13_08730 [Acidimicrobiia bacterium]|nr:hypothetical protein [Acidimicrobiia bacterium]
MKVRCGACRTEFEAEAEGRHACPTCGAVNEVSATPPPQGSPAAPDQPAAPLAAAPPTAGGSVGAPAPAPALTKVACDQCSFEFVVGDIEVATCPNCSSQVTP